MCGACAENEDANEENLARQIRGVLEEQPAKRDSEYDQEQDLRDNAVFECIEKLALGNTTSRFLRCEALFNEPLTFKEAKHVDSFTRTVSAAHSTLANGKIGFPSAAHSRQRRLMRVTIVQLDSVWENKPANFAKVGALLKSTPPAAGGLVVLPEMFATGFSLDLSATLRTGTETEAAFCAALAKEHGCCVIGGCIAPATDGRAYNIAAAFSPDGELARYVKQRPFTGAGEHEAHIAGSSPVIFEWGGFTVAPLVCYDLRFPELFRAGLGLGATLFVVIAAWPVRRIEHWLTLLRARAIENQAYVIGVNRTGNEPRFAYTGRSIVVDPHGTVILDAGESECAASVELDPALPANWRAEFPAVRDWGWSGPVA